MAIGALVLVVQEALVPQVRILGVFPDIIPAFVICVAVVGEVGQATVVGFVMGILEDLFLVGPFGVSGLTYTLLAYLTGRVGQSTEWKGSSSAIAVVCFFGTVLSELGHGLILALLGNSTLSRPGSILGYLLVGLINLLVGPVIARYLQGGRTRPAMSAPQVAGL